MEAPGENLLIKLWETLAEKGIGGLLQPWQEKRVANARLEIRKNELLNLAHVESQIIAIKSGKSFPPIQGNFKLIVDLSGSTNQNTRIEPTIDLSDLIIRTSQIEISENIRKEVNVAKAVIIAEDILAQDSQVPSEASIDDDWLFSWREYAGRVSSEELQSLWGKVLAGEIKQPNSYSMRTLEFLKNLSKSEAELISRAAKFVIGQWIYRNNDTILEKENIKFIHLLLLQDIGILSGVDTGLTQTFGSLENDKFVIHFFALNIVILLSHNDPAKKVVNEVYLLTSVGREVLKLASIHINNEYLESIAKEYVKQGFDVKIADWVPVHADGRGRFFNAKIIEA